MLKPIMQLASVKMEDRNLCFIEQIFVFDILNPAASNLDLSLLLAG